MQVLIIHPVSKDLFPRGKTGVVVFDYPFSIVCLAVGGPVHDICATFFSGEVAGAFMDPPVTPLGGALFVGEEEWCVCP